MDILYRPKYIFNDYQNDGIFIFSAADEELANNAIFQLEINDTESYKDYEENYTYNISKIFEKSLKEIESGLGSILNLLKNNILTINNFNILFQINDSEYYFIWPEAAEIEVENSCEEKEYVITLDEFIVKNLLE